MNPNPTDDLVEKAIKRAQRWQDRANELLTHEEKAIQEQMMRLLSHPMDKVLLTRMIDQSFRSHDSKRVADQISTLLHQYGMPDFFSKVDKLLVQMFLGVGRHFPEFTVSRMIEKMRHDSSRAIISGEPAILHAHLKKRKKQGVRMNVNHLGEAVLGEAEAHRRLQTYLKDLENPLIEYISVKISTIYSQIHSLAFDATVNILVDRLSRLYRQAARHEFVRENGSRVPKFVNLDMEEYRDLEITTTAFMQTLSQPEFLRYSAGIVLQAYLPDSYMLQRSLTDWARKRVANGGSPIRIRIVKGANMEMEQLEAALFNWPLTPYDNKRDVDANYKRMVRFGMVPDNIHAVHLGIASHNLFELAYAHELGRQNRVTDYYYFEMLEGMADHVRRALTEMAGDMLLYAPVAAKTEFINAIAYLIRRLDENTAKENFLCHAPNLKTDSPAWDFLKDQFIASVNQMTAAATTPHRNQDRRRETFPAEMGTFYENEFRNEPDTDWALAPNREWARAIRKKWQKHPGDPAIPIPLVVGGREIYADRKTHAAMDPSQYHDQVCVARHALAEDNDITGAVAVAAADPDGWRQKSHHARHRILSRVAANLRIARGNLIGAAVANTGKIVTEADVEVSEAIDFAEYYPFSATAFTSIDHLHARGKGVGVVIAPWNFPIAIPCGGLTAALAAGNTVIFKPSSDAVLVAWELCRCFWDAGISRNTLQFLPCPGNRLGTKLISHPDIDFVILTGGTDTGLAMLAEKPDLFLSAETGGKNATIVTDMADRGQAIKNVVFSAFGHCGQKCSATSLLILEKEVFDDPHFKKQLIDAAQSISVGSAWEFRHRMGPMIRPPEGALKQALTRLLPGETWALKPEMVADNPHLWTPGIKYGVQPGSMTHLTEFFGPLLGVMRADNLSQAIDYVNQTGYGLTSGLESLDRREQDLWKKQIQAGNLYINRGTTGAIVLRQPFGGMGKSALGPAIKAGGPYYVTQFMEFSETGFPRIGAIEKETRLLRLTQRWAQQIAWGQFPKIALDLKKTIRAIQSYLYHAEQTFYRKRDYFHLRGQDNILWYRPMGTIVVRIHPNDSIFETLARMAAVMVAKSRLVVSIPSDLDNPVTTFLSGRQGKELLQETTIVRESDADLIAAISRIQRIRYAAPDRVPETVFTAAAKTGFYIARAPVVMDGSIELIHYFINQSLCDAYHRYGNLGERGMIDEADG